MTFVCKYVALYVPDVRAAEGFYREAFAMDLLFRESEREDGTWHTLGADLDWDDADARGIGVDMVAVRRDSLVLALFHGTPAPGTLFEISIGVMPGEAAAIRARLGAGATALESAPEWLRFEDPFGFRWVFQPHDAGFRSNGEIAGRWIP